MWPNRRLTDLFKIEHPIVLSPMSRIGSVELAAAVCAAGGLGSIGCALLSPEEAARDVRNMRALTDRPFSLNFFCHQPPAADAGKDAAWLDRMLPYYDEYGMAFDAAAPRMAVDPFGEAMCRLVEDARPAVVSFHVGLPAAPFVDRIKAAGCLLISSATTVDEAIWLESHGVDAVIAQGTEAGGHRGTFLADDVNKVIDTQLGTFALVPQIVDMVRVPVIAAGGVADGRGIAAAFALGAAGVQMGTAYLRCPETTISPMYRDALRQVRSGATVLTNVFTGRAGRALKNRLVSDVGPVSPDAPAFPGAIHATMQLAAEVQRRGHADFTPFWAGQASPIGSEMPAEALTRALVEAALKHFRRPSMGPMA
ncbi:MAG: nitronate monooxygenase [Tardiphaga sp.]